MTGPVEPATKVCRDCGKEKEVAEFHKCHSHGKVRLRSMCKLCHRARTYAFRKTPKGRATDRRAKLFARYGITGACYDEALAQQGGRCAICGKKDTKMLCVDHDHTTGKLRGLLCSNCNTGIGLFGDDPAVAKAAAQYLEKHL